MKIRKEIIEKLNEFKEIRREIHMNPEIGFNTKQTMNKIKDILKMQPANHDEISGIFYLPAKKPCIAFRCELDGLPIQEQNKIEYKSKNDYMHACGHDAHIAILIETIIYFMHHEHQHALLFIFQPAEESGAGAKYMIEQGIFEKYEIQELYATHVMPLLGDKIGCKEGIFMAKSSEIHIEIQGKGAHAAHREFGINAMQATTLFLNSIYKIENDFKPNIIHFGKLVSGEVGNAVASNAFLTGTMRCFDERAFELIQTFLINQLKMLDEKMHTTSKIIFSNGYDLLVNDLSLVNQIKGLLENDYIEVNAMALSEDFSFYTKKCKCCYYLCGLTSEIDLHDSCFDLNEEECLKAIELNIRIVESKND